jgi:two-component system, LytTR family, sensor kinase
MFSGNLRYWMCQVAGWGVWAAIMFYFRFVVYAESYNNVLQGDGAKIDKASSIYINAVIITFFAAVLITHILKVVLKKTDWLKYSLNNVLLIFLVGATASGIALYFTSDILEKKSGNSNESYIISVKLDNAKKMEEEQGLANIDYYSPGHLPVTEDQQKKIQNISQSTNWYRNDKGEWRYINKRSPQAGIYQFIILCGLWLLIYMVWHYVEKNRKDREDRLRLEAMVKELELKTIKSHINPHFIFNALNSIRALVDENPGRARTAITELSNILRSSMQAEKSETVPLEKEMDIVKDYLALEQMRFEDRLKIEYEIDDDTLDQQVPPMMVQTLVENAIKHGISKQINGGVIKIYSDFVNNHYELKVQNTGRLNGTINANGFGLKSTQDRLKLLFGPNSRFGIKEVNGQMVEVKVELPVQLKD